MQVCMGHNFDIFEPYSVISKDYGCQKVFFLIGNNEVQTMVNIVFLLSGQRKAPSVYVNGHHPFLDYSLTVNKLLAAIL